MIKSNLLDEAAAVKHASKINLNELYDQITKLLNKRTNIILIISFLLGRASSIAGGLPFALPFYAASYRIKKNRIIMAVFIIVGIASGRAGVQLYVTVSAILLFNALSMLFSGKDTFTAKYMQAFLVFISVFIPEFLISAFQGFLLYDILIAFFHAFTAFIMLFVYKRNKFTSEGGIMESISSPEDAIKTAILASICILGLFDINIIGFSIKNIMCILLILLCGYKMGMGAGGAVGLTAGLIVNMYSHSTPLIISSYGFCGLLSGVLNKLGKMGSVIGFIMGNAILTLYLNGSSEVLIHLQEITAASLIFIFIPDQIMNKINSVFHINIAETSDKRSYGLRIKEMTVNRLKKYSKVFCDLSGVLKELSVTSSGITKNDIAYFFDRIADRVCRDCSLNRHCWEKNFYNTYQVVYKMVEKLDEKGRLDRDDIPPYFCKRCERLNNFIEQLNFLYELFRTEMVWKNKIFESRSLIAGQMDGLSRIIQKLALEIDTDIKFRREIEDAITFELIKNGIKDPEVSVYQNRNKKFEVGVSHAGCRGSRICINVIGKRISRILGRKMVREESICALMSKKKSCLLLYTEEELLSVTTGFASVPRQENEVSGDSYSFMNTGDGKYLIVLSDGMGTGTAASAQSKIAVGLIEQFMEAGFDKDETIRMVNAALLLKSEDESCLSIDLSVIDLQSGEVDFAKIGSANTYIKHNDSVETVKSLSLPAGIVNNINVEYTKKTLSSGDFIIMLSDGVAEAFYASEREPNAENLKGYLKEIKSINPQHIADTILNQAIELNGEKITDDMTVIVSKIWSKNYIEINTAI